MLKFHVQLNSYMVQFGSTIGRASSISEEVLRRNCVDYTKGNCVDQIYAIKQKSETILEAVICFYGPWAALEWRWQSGE